MLHAHQLKKLIITGVALILFMRKTTSTNLVIRKRESIKDLKDKKPLPMMIIVMILKRRIGRRLRGGERRKRDCVRRRNDKNARTDVAEEKSVAQRRGEARTKVMLLLQMVNMTKGGNLIQVRMTRWKLIIRKGLRLSYGRRLSNHLKRRRALVIEFNNYISWNITLS